MDNDQSAHLTPRHKTPYYSHSAHASKCMRLAKHIEDGHLDKWPSVCKAQFKDKTFEWRKQTTLNPLSIFALASV